MRPIYPFAASVAGWTTAVVLTIVGTIKPSLAGVMHMWQVMALAVAVTSSISLIAARAQAELTEDLSDPPSPPSPIRS